MAEIGAKAIRRAAYASIIKKLKEGKKLTAADMEFIREWEREERQQEGGEAGEAGGEAKELTLAHIPGGATLEEDLAEWTLRDGIVRGLPRRLSILARAHQVEIRDLEKKLWKVQRNLLKQYGFEGTKKAGALTGNEALALQWVKSIGQVSRASAQWELHLEQMESRRMDAEGDLERFAVMVGTLKQLVERRDGLAIKVRELSAKEKRLGTGRGQKAHSFEIVIADGGAEDEEEI